MQTSNRKVFRADAMRRYLRGQEKTVLPEMTPPRTFVALWIAIGLLVSAGVGLGFMRLPRYTSGSAVIVNYGGALPAGGPDVVVVAFLPAKDRDRIRPGQTLFVGFGPESEAVAVPIEEVLPGVLSPLEALMMFRLDSNTAGAVTQPSAVALARWRPPAEALLAEKYLGSVVQADVEVGSHPVIALLPLVGHFFDSSSSGSTALQTPEPAHTHQAPESP